MASPSKISNPEAPPKYLVLCVQDVDVRTAYGAEGMKAAPEQNTKYAIETKPDHWVFVNGEWMLNISGMQHLYQQAKIALSIRFNQENDGPPPSFEPGASGGSF